MPFPNMPRKAKHDAIFSGKDMVALRRQLGKFPKMEAPKSVLLSIETSLPKRMRRRHPYRKVGRFVGDMLILKKTEGKVGVMVNFGGGAPLIVGMVEELIAWGVQNFVLLTWAGALQPDLDAGDVVIVDKALRDEGTSHHYLAYDRYIECSQPLTERYGNALRKKLPKILIGPTWTTDAPYRETFQEIRVYQKEGIQTVDMETSALFALGKVRKVNTISAVVVSDNLSQNKWQPPKNLKAIHSSFDTLYDVAVNLLMEL